MPFALDGTPLPDHPFTPDPKDMANINNPDTICMAVLHTATEDEHGYGHSTQCGHPRKEHPGLT